MNKSKRKFFSVLAIAVVALFALACVAGFAACGDDDTKSDATVSGVTLDRSTLSLTVGGTAASLNATVVMSDGGAYSGSYTWSSDNEDAAKVTGNGASATVTAVAAGTATITVTVNNSKTATCEVTVASSSSSDSGTTGGNQGTTGGTEVTGTSKIRAEAEYAEIEVDESALYYWLNNEVDQGEYISGMGFLFNVQQDTAASGGYKLGYLAHDNPTATFKITSDVTTSATLTLHAASCDVQPLENAGTQVGGSAIYGLMLASINDYTGQGHDILKVNGSSVTLSGTLSGNKSVFSDDGLAMNNWGDLTASINLVSGENTIMLTHDGAGVSWDYIDIDTGNTAANLSFTETDNSSLVGYDASWEPVGEADFEAETDAVLTDATGSSASMSKTSTGVTNITNGDTLTFNVTVSAETGEAAIYAYVSSDGTLSASDITISVDGTQMSNLTLQSGMIWGTVDKLTAGSHTIVITCASSSTLTMDKLSMDWDYASDGSGHYTASTIEQTASSGT